MYVCHPDAVAILHAEESTVGDVESQKPVTTWKVGSGVSHQQVGNTWTSGDDIVSLSMSGDLNVFDKRSGEKPARIIQVGLPMDSNSYCFTQSCLPRVRPKRSLPLWPQVARILSLSVHPKAECCRSLGRSIKKWKARAMRVLSQGLVSHHPGT